jgi:alpha-methylacyl-CoA racemase
MMDVVTAAKPLTGTRVIELAGLGPAPHAAMILADLGADVLRLERPRRPGDGPARDDATDPSLRGKRRVRVDLKADSDRAQALALIAQADVLVEGFRPGVTERLGLGPDDCRARNPRLVYARMTGWGQDGPLAGQAGHDINYISVTGVLHAIGPAQAPMPPLNLVGDFGGGSMLVVIGILTALLERERSGEGQVVDSAMVDGASLLMQMIWWQRDTGGWRDERASNGLDGGAPYYRTYRCADGRFVAVGCIEPKFYTLMLNGLGLVQADLPPQRDPAGWDSTTAAIAAAFAEHPRDHWAALFEGTDACVTPVLAMSEVTAYPQIAVRRSVVDNGVSTQAAPAPRFARSHVDRIAPIDITMHDLAAVRAEWSRAESAQSAQSAQKSQES